MKDQEMLERFFRNELTSSELKEFRQRLASDTEFKELYEIERLVHQAAIYANEKKRIKQVVSIPLEQPKPEFAYSWNQALWPSAIVSVVIWLATNISSGLLNINPSLLKWIGLLLAFGFSLILLARSEERFKIQMVYQSALNGFIFFIMASGLDAINQGVDLRSSANKAVLIPFTQHSVWWPTKTLVDSLADVNEENQKLINEVNSIKQTLKSVQDSCLRFNYGNVFPIVRPKSRIVANGSTYEADMFLGVSFPALSPDMKINGKQIPVEIDPTTGLKIGKIKFPVNEKAFDKNERANPTYVASIVFDRNEYLATVEYEVVKPTIRVTTGTAPSLYLGCRNPVNIEVPMLGASYNPSFSAKGAELITGSETGKVIIIPNERRVEITVSNAGAFIGAEVFDAKPVPRPRVIAKDNDGLPIDLKNGFKAGSLAGLRVNADPDENFRNEVPKDANFRINRMSVILARGTARIQELTLTSELVDLSAWRSLMRPGDRIIIEPKSIVRTTYTGGQEQFTVSGQDIVTIPIQ